MDNRQTRQAIATSVNVEACSICIEKMGLELFESPYSPNVKRENVDVGAAVTNRRERKQDNSTLTSNFHVNIRNERISKGWTQKELAMKLNERLNTIQRIENGSRPTDELVGKLEKILRISLLANSDASNEQSLSTTSGRDMTIADALEDFLTKGDGDG